MEMPLPDQLKTLLANTQVVYHQAHGYHWNVKGSDFAQYHELFGEIYGDLYGSIDPLAENIRKLDANAPFSMEDFVELSSITVAETADDSPNALAKELLSSLDAMVEMLKETFDDATEANEQGIANFIADRLDATQKWVWQLKSSVNFGCGCEGEGDCTCNDEEKSETDLPSIPGVTAAAEEDCGCDDQAGFTVAGKRCECDSEELSVEELAECGCDKKKKGKKMMMAEYGVEQLTYNGGRPIDWTNDFDVNFLNGINEHWKAIMEMTSQTNRMGSRVSMQVQGYSAYLRGLASTEIDFVNRSLGLPVAPEGSGKMDNTPPVAAYEIQLALLDFDMDLGL
jgi:starvation-inducible DNA-binding protein